MPPVRFRYQTIEFDDTDIHVKTLHDKHYFADDDGAAAAARLGISSATWSLRGVIWPSKASGTFHSPNISFHFIGNGERKFEIKDTLRGNKTSATFIRNHGASLQRGDKPETGTFPDNRH